MIPWWSALIFFWAVLCGVAVAFAKVAKETDWKQFILINLIPLFGSILSIFVYAVEIGKSSYKDGPLR